MSQFSRSVPLRTSVSSRLASTGGRGGDHRSAEVREADDARWARFFSEKFEDKGYYGYRIPTPQSSFGAFAGRMEVLCRG